MHRLQWRDFLALIFFAPQCKISVAASYCDRIIKIFELTTTEIQIKTTTKLFAYTEIAVFPFSKHDLNNIFALCFASGYEYLQTYSLHLGPFRSLFLWLLFPIKVCLTSFLQITGLLENFYSICCFLSIGLFLFLFFSCRSTVAACAKLC